MNKLLLHQQSGSVGMSPFVGKRMITTFIISTKRYATFVIYLHTRLNVYR
jgi:hypothetical protein